MRLLVATGLGVALAASLVPARHTAVRMAAFSWGTSTGGGVTDVTTGRRLDPAPEDEFGADTSTTVLPYRAGARYRIPVILTLEEGVRDVLVVEARVVTGTYSAARPVPGVYTLRCCALDGAVPWEPFRLGVRPAGMSFVASSALIGLDVELCCTPPPAGWVERLPGFELTYRRLGVTRTVHVPFPPIQQVVIRT